MDKIIVPEAETETIINYSKAPIGEWAEVYTTDKTIMKRYTKFIQKYPDRCRLVAEDQYSMTFSVHPKSAGIFPRAVKEKTEEQRQAAVERMMKARSACSLSSN